MAGTIGENLENAQNPEEGEQEQPQPQAEPFGTNLDDTIDTAQKIHKHLTGGGEKPEEEKKNKENTEKNGDKKPEQNGPNVAKTGEKAVEKGVEKAGEKAIEKGAEKVAETGVKAAAGMGAKTAGTALGGPVGTFVMGALEKAGEWAYDNRKWLFKWGIRITAFIVFILLATMVGFASTYWGMGKKGLFGGTDLTSTNPLQNNSDILALLAAAGSKEKKLTLLTESTDKIIQTLQDEKASYAEIAGDTYKKAIPVIDKMIPIIQEISNLGKQIDNEKTDKETEAKNAQLKKQINEKYDEWKKLWDEYIKIIPQDFKVMYQYVALANKFKANASASDPGWQIFSSTRLPSGNRTKAGLHDGYDINGSEGGNVIAGWPGKETYIESGWGNGSSMVRIEYKAPSGKVYQIEYGHIIPTPGLLNTDIKVGTVIGKIRTVYVPHVDIKVRDSSGQWVDWGIGEMQ